MKEPLISLGFCIRICKIRKLGPTNYCIKVNWIISFKCWLFPLCSPFETNEGHKFLIVVPLFPLLQGPSPHTSPILRVLLQLPPEIPGWTPPRKHFLLPQMEWGDCSPGTCSVQLSYSVMSDSLQPHGDPRDLYCCVKNNGWSHVCLCLRLQFCQGRDDGSDFLCKLAILCPSDPSSLCSAWWGPNKHIRSNQSVEGLLRICFPLFLSCLKSLQKCTSGNIQRAEYICGGAHPQSYWRCLRT